MGFYNNRGVDDTKKSRQIILEKANLILNSLLATLGSTYVSSNAFPVFAVQLKSLSFEAARVIANAEDVYNDLIFTTTRPEFLFQNLESYLFFNQAFPFANKDDAAVRNFLLALIKAYFNGATKRSISAALELAVENQARVELEELFLGGRQNELTDWVPLAHSFLVSIFVENANLDIVKLQASINFLTSLIKPAHTALNTRFVFQENPSGFGGQCQIIYDPVTNLPLITPDGFEVTQKTKDNQICDVFNIKLFDYGYEDLRDNCFANLEITRDGEPAYVVDANKIYTRFGPLGNGAGQLLDNTSQVTVLVNGSPVAVQSVNALKGIITLENAIPNAAVVTVSYSYLRRHFEFLTLNNPNTTISQFDPYDDSLPSFRYSSVIWSPNLEIPDKTPVNCDYRYTGYDGVNSSLFNDFSTLAFNRLGTARDRLNDYYAFKSYGYDEQPIFNLNYGVPLFIRRQEKSLVARDDSREVFKLNDPYSRLNSLVYNILGGTIAHKVSSDKVRKVYADLEIESTCYGSVTDRLKPMCEDGLDLFFDFANNTGQDTYAGIKPNVDEVLSTNNTGFVLNRFVLFVPRSGYDVSFSRLDLADKQIEDPIPQFTETPSGFHQAIDWLELDYKTKQDDYLVTNDGHIINSSGSLLPPYPKFPIEDADRWAMELNEYDKFLVGRFCLNDRRSHMNSLDEHGIVRARPGTNCDSYISDYLALFDYQNPEPEKYLEFYEGIDETSLHMDIFDFLNEPVSAFQDVLAMNLHLIDNQDFFPTSGVLDQLNFGLQDFDTYQTSGVTDIESYSISGAFIDGFIHGHVVLFPYFLASFAPIYDMIAPSGYSIAMGQNGGFQETFPPMQDLYMNNFNPVFLEKMPKMIEDLKFMTVQDSAAIFQPSDAEIQLLDSLATKFDVAESGYDFDDIRNRLARPEKTDAEDVYFEPSGGPEGNFALIG